MPQHNNNNNRRTYSIFSIALLLIVCAPLSSLYTILAPYFYIDSSSINYLARISFLYEQYHTTSSSSTASSEGATVATAADVISDDDILIVPDETKTIISTTEEQIMDDHDNNDEESSSSSPTIKKTGTTFQNNDDKKNSNNKKYNVTFEQLIWSIIFKDPSILYSIVGDGGMMTTSSSSPVHNYYKFSFSSSSSFFLSTTENMEMQHWTFVIPWSISFIMSVIVPTILTFMSYVQRTTRNDEDDDDEIDVDDDDDDDPWISRTKKYKRKVNKLSILIKDHKKILHESDMSNLIDREGVPYWNLPLPGIITTNTSKKRKVLGICSICLNNYTCGDEVVWSSNLNCPHVFHFDCILSWLLMIRRRKGEEREREQQKQKQQCPCCRQIYIIPTKKI